MIFQKPVKLQKQEKKKRKNVRTWCVLAMELEDIGREKFDRSLAKRQICQYFPPSINCAIRHSKYTECVYANLATTDNL